MNTTPKIRVGSRGSGLALTQVKEVFSLLKDKGIELEYELKTFKTKGDRDKKTPLINNPADDFFTDTIDQALLDNKIDIAIHSAKDLPEQLKTNLDIFALTACLDPADAFVGHSQFCELKPGAYIGTSSLLRSEAIKALNPKLNLVYIRGTIEERLTLVKEGKLDGIIVAAVALKRLGLEDTITDIMPWETTPLQGQLAVVGRFHNGALKQIFSAIDVRKSYGHVLLVGAGPGDPDLVTVKGIKALRQADCVFYDYLTNKNLLNYAKHAEKVYVGKRKGAHALPQHELSKLIRLKATQGLNVVRLKGGDPLIFGRGADEIEYLRAWHINVDVVPGVSSATAIPAKLGLPLTARQYSSSVAFLSGHEGQEKADDPRPVRVPNVDTLVFLMGLTKLPTIVSSLKNADWKEDTPVMVISKGTYADEKVVVGTIQDIEKKVEDESISPPALIIVGQTIKFWRRHLRTDERILYLGTNPQKYRGLGRVIHFPVLNIAGIEMGKKERRAVTVQLDRADMVMFTSRFAVRYFLQILQQENYPRENFEGKDMVVVGKDTAQTLREFGLRPKLIATEETSQGLFEAITSAYKVKNRTILFPRSSLSNPYLKQNLTEAGAEVIELPVYQNTKENKRELPEEKVDKILFTSPSTVRFFLQDHARIPKDWHILAKGPATSEALREFGYQSEVLVYD